MVTTPNSPWVAGVDPLTARSDGTSTPITAARLQNMEARIEENRLGIANDPRWTTVTSVPLTGSTTLAAATHSGKVLDGNSATPITVTVPSTLTEPWADGVILGAANINSGPMTFAFPGANVIPNDGKLTLATAGATGRFRKLPGTAVPQPSTGKLADYDADTLTGAEGSAVTSWADSSGNSLPAAAQATVANQPVLRLASLNGHNTVAFDGNNDFLSLSGTALGIAQNRGALMLCIVYTYPTAAAGTRTLFGLSSGTSAAAVRAQIYHRDPTAFLGAGGRRLDADTVQFVSGTASTVGGAEVVTACFDFSSRVLTVYKNGTQIAQSTTFQTAGSTSNTASLSGTIGSNLAGASEYFSGRIARIFAYSAIDTTTRTALHSYVQNRYAITVAGATPGDTWLREGAFTA